VEAERLNAAYQANEVAADNKYKGRLLAVSGTVQSISKDFADDTYLAIATSNEFMPIHANLQQRYVAQAAALQKGQQITVVCKGNGMMIGSPMLKDCAIASEPVNSSAMSSPQQTDRTTSVVAQQPEPIQTSFDCKKAHSTSEMLICGDSELAALDRDLAQIYAQAKAVAPDKQAFANMTRQNWNWREHNCRDKGCLIGWYADQKRRFANVLNQDSQLNAGEAAKQQSPVVQEEASAPL
jgi:hypothetical protein